MLSAGLLWWSVSRAILDVGASKWLIPIVCFSLLFVCLSLSIVLIKEILPVELLLLAVMLSSFVFVLALWHLALVLIGCLFVFMGSKKIRRDLELNVKIDLWKSMQMGRSFLIIGLAIVITSQYYFTVQKAGVEKTIPHFETGALTSQITTRILPWLNPNFKALKQEGITVDQFILQTGQNQAQNISPSDVDTQANAIIDQQFGKNIPDAQRQQLRQQVRDQVAQSEKNLTDSNQALILQQGRLQLSQMVGKDLSGNEKMSDVFSGFIDKKINDYFSPSVDNPGASKLLPLIMSGVLFFTIWPAGSFLSIFLILIAYLIFLVFVRWGIVTVRKIPVEMEVIE